MGMSFVFSLSVFLAFVFSQSGSIFLHQCQNIFFQFSNSGMLELTFRKVSSIILAGWIHLIIITNGDKFVGGGKTPLLYLAFEPLFA